MASQNGHSAVVANLCEAGANVNQARDDGATPLWMACQEGQVECAQQLSSYNAARTFEADLTAESVATEEGREALAAWLADHEVPALVITTDPLEVEAATRKGVLSFQGSLDSEDLLMAMDSVGVKIVVGVSRFQEVNSLVIERAAEAIGRANVYFLPRSDDGVDAPESSHGAVMARRPFGREATQVKLERLVAGDWAMTAVSADSHDDMLLDDAIPLLAIDADGPRVLTGPPEKAPAEGVVRVYLADRGKAAVQGSGGNASP